jgi:hypothetical protein
MKALLLDTRNDKHYTGDTYAELIAHTPLVSLDIPGRCFRIQGVAHPFQYSNEYTADELVKEMSRDAVNFLCRNAGFVLYRKPNLIV